MFDVSYIPTFTDNYVWMIESDSGLWVVDPGAHEPVIEAIKQHNKPLKGILITHRHWDHISGVVPIVRTFKSEPLTVYRPEKLALPLTSISVCEGDTLHLDDITMTVLATPGHTKDHLAYYCDAENALFSGDSLFASGCGRIFDGSMATLFATLQRLATLPKETQVYATHEYTLANIEFALAVEPHNRELSNFQSRCLALRNAKKPTLPTNIGQELKTNPFLRTEEPNILKSVSTQIKREVNDSFEAFSELRLWKNRF